jgi:hypothetical protein
MDEEDKTKNTLSFEGTGLENPTVVISTKLRWKYIAEGFRSSEM